MELSKIAFETLNNASTFWCAVAAIAACAAVVLNLKFKRTKIAIKIGFASAVYGGTATGTPDFLKVDVSNLGKGDVCISSIAFTRKKRSYVLPCMPLGSQLPTLLEPTREVSFLFHNYSEVIKASDYVAVRLSCGKTFKKRIEPKTYEIAERFKS